MKRMRYVAGIVLAVVLGTVAVTVWGNTRVLGPLLLVFGIYLLLGCLIKLCKTHEKLKDTILCAIDLLWWLP